MTFVDKWGEGQDLLQTIRDAAVQKSESVERVANATKEPIDAMDTR